VGAYERELHAAIREIQANDQIDTIVNVGCAEGYYAVGLARTMPQAYVYAYDLNPTMRRLCRRTAQRNGALERLTIQGLCDLDALQALAGARTVVVADCEGCERDLLRPDEVPLLRESTVVVELHDFDDPTTSSTILERFKPTHEAEVILSEPRYPVEHPEPGQLPGVSPAEHEIALLEFRPSVMQWAVLRPRGH
jgi:precorrin-6B methylase 2